MKHTVSIKISGFDLSSYPSYHMVGCILPYGRMAILPYGRMEVGCVEKVWQRPKSLVPALLNDQEIRADFFNVIKNFMIQSGDPLGTGAGGPGYSFRDEIDFSLLHTGKGILSMANSGPSTNGSQFFITFRPTAHLNNRHTIYGKAESEESLKTIAKLESLARPGGQRNSKPLEPIIITKATILIE